MDISEADETINVANPSYVHFMRYLLMMRLIEKEKLITVYKKMFPEDEGIEQFNDTIEAIDGMLRNAKLELKEVNCEILMRPCYVVISTLYRPDKIWPCNRTEDELEFIKRVIHEIMISGRGTVSSIHCLNLNVKLVKSDCDNLLKTLVSKQWLKETTKGVLAMSALCMTELEPYLQENYRDILNNCTFCRRVVYFGDICSHCNVVGHRLCLKKYQQSMKKSFKCPSCRKNWDERASTSQMEEMDCDDE